MATAKAPTPTSRPIDIPIDRLRAWRADLDALGERTKAKLGKEDVEYIESVMAWSRRFEIAGRGLIHVSLDPFTWSAGVFALFVHKQLESVELPHTIWHGAYDHIPGGEHIHPQYRSQLPVWTDGWKHEHNVRHHGFTNILGKDPDTRWGTMRFFSSIEPRWYHRFQLAEATFGLVNLFGIVNMHVCGLMDIYAGPVRGGGDDVLPDRRWSTIVKMHVRAARAQLPYLAREYVFYPLLAGPMAPKVMLGNFLSSAMRNVFTGLAIYSSHVGEEIADYPEGTKAGDRTHWMAMQLATTKNFEVSKPVSILAGALDRQIEHHLFPKLPPNRLREIAHEFREICEKHGMAYRTAPWGETIRGVFRRIWSLGRA